MRLGEHQRRILESEAAHFGEVRTSGGGQNQLRSKHG